MDNRVPRSAPVPAFETTTRLFARALGWSPQRLLETFRPATADDLPALLDFRRRRGWDDAAYLRWRYGLTTVGHPFGQLWLLRDESKVLATIGSEVQPIRHAGHLYDGQYLMDVQLEPALEGAGGGAWLNQAMCEQASATLAIGANGNSLGLVRRLFAPLPNRTYHVLPLDAAVLLRQRGTPVALAALAGPFVNAGWRLRERLAKDAGMRALAIEEATGVAPEWLEAVHAALPPSLACVAPSAGHLDWRLFRNPRAAYRLFTAARGGRCVGYLAARHVPAEGGRLAAMHVIDWKLADEDASATLSALLLHAIAQARLLGCSKVFTTALDTSAALVLARLGFMSRQAEALVAGVQTPLPLPGVGGVGRWQITDLSFDNDGCF